MDASITIAEAFNDWMTARMASGTLSPHTVNAYTQDITAISGHLHALMSTGTATPPTPAAQHPQTHVTTNDLTTRTLRTAFAAYAATHSPASLARTQSTWRGLTAHLTREGILTGDPMPAIPHAKIPHRQPKPLRDTERTAATLLTHLQTPTPPTSRTHRRHEWRERDLAVIATLLLTGMRSAELRGLTRADRYGTGNDAYMRVIGKGNKERSVPVSEPLLNVLDTYEKTRQDRFPTWHPRYEDTMFVNTKNQPLTAGALRWLVTAALQDAGLSGAKPQQAAVHSLRHTAATLLASNGASALEIQTLLGHASIATSQGYLLAIAREVRASAAANPLYRTLT